jgi:hypothetical protein
MNWVRSKVRQGALLALFALAIQLGLSFGHVHADGLAQAATVTAQAAVSDLDATAQPLAPSQHHPDGLAADGCAICATIALFGTLVAAVPPSLAVPASFALRIETAPADVALPGLTRTAFQSRAPPRS